MSPRMQMAFRILGSVVFIYMSVSLLVALFSCSLIFQPPRSTYKSLPHQVLLKTPDGKTLAAVHRVHPDARYTVLFSHGNAEDLGMMIPYLEDYYQMGFSVFAWDYRGYGKSTGKPREKNVFQDLDVLYDYLVNTAKVPPERIILHGRSLGGGAATEFARRYPVAGLILESTFVSAFRVVTRIPLFFGDKFLNLEKLARVNCPVLVIHGKKDSVVAFWHGKRLYKKANSPKYKFWVDKADHNDLEHVAGASYWKAIRDFADTLLAVPDQEALIRQLQGLGPVTFRIRDYDPQTNMAVVMTPGHSPERKPYQFVDGKWIPLWSPYSP